MKNVTILTLVIHSVQCVCFSNVNQFVCVLLSLLLLRVECRLFLIIAFLFIFLYLQTLITIMKIYMKKHLCFTSVYCIKSMPRAINSLALTSEKLRINKEFQEPLMHRSLTFHMQDSGQYSINTEDAPSLQLKLSIKRFT